MNTETKTTHLLQDGCIFCAIVSEQSPATFVYRAPRCSAFLDIQPVNPGLVLIIPNNNATYLAELDPDDGVHMFRIGQKIAAALLECLHN